MRWTVTIKDETYGTGSEILTYALRVTRAGGTVRLSVQNSGSGVVKEGRCLIPSSVASILGNALRLAASGTEHMDFTVSVDETKIKKS
jgi:hypothetical protein